MNRTTPVSVNQVEEFMWYSPIPVGSAVIIEGRKDYRKNDGKVITHQIYHVFIVPVQECTLSNLEMLAIDTPCQLHEQSHLDLPEFLWVCHVKDFFNLV